MLLAKLHHHAHTHARLDAPERIGQAAHPVGKTLHRNAHRMLARLLRRAVVQHAAVFKILEQTPYVHGEHLVHAPSGVLVLEPISASVQSRQIERNRQPCGSIPYRRNGIRVQTGVWMGGHISVNMTGDTLHACLRLGESQILRGLLTHHLDGCDVAQGGAHRIEAVGDSVPHRQQERFRPPVQRLALQHIDCVEQLSDNRKHLLRQTFHLCPSVSLFRTVRPVLFGQGVAWRPDSAVGRQVTHIQELIDERIDVLRAVLRLFKLPCERGERPFRIANGVVDPQPVLDKPIVGLRQMLRIERELKEMVDRGDEEGGGREQGRRFIFPFLRRGIAHLPD